MFKFFFGICLLLVLTIIKRAMDGEKSSSIKIKVRRRIPIVVRKKT